MQFYYYFRILFTTADVTHSWSFRILIVPSVLLKLVSIAALGQKVCNIVDKKIQIIIRLHMDALILIAKLYSCFAFSF